MPAKSVPPRPVPRLYLATPVIDDAAPVRAVLAAALAAADVAAVLLRLSPSDPRTLVTRVKALAPVVQGAGAALLLDGHDDLVARGGADGAHLAGIRAMQAALPHLKPERIVGVGGLRRQKGFDSLVRAFAQVHAQRPCRLMILGDGHLRESLLQLADELGVADDLALPGFDPRPYRIVARAALFVLASRWEGSPNALTEALALGTPVVATDCPSGPREILAGGEVAPLVAVDDVDAMGAAIRRTLDDPGDRARRIAAVAEYTVETCAARYHALFDALLADRAA